MTHLNASVHSLPLLLLSLLNGCLYFLNTLDGFSLALLCVG